MDIQAAKAAIPLPSAEVNLGGTSTSETQFLTASAQNGVAAGTSLICYFPGSGVLRNRPFKIRCGGRVKGGSAASNFTGSVYFGTSSTIGSNTKIMTTGAVALAANQGQWALEGRFSWDTTSGIIEGVQSGYMLNNVVALAAITNTVSTTTLTSESTSNGLTATATFSTGQAANAAYVDWFEIIPE